MKSSGALLISLCLSSLMPGCFADGGAGGSTVEPSSSSSSTSGPAADPTASTPTTTESSDPATTGPFSTTSTSGTPNGDSSSETGGSGANAESSSSSATEASPEDCGNEVVDPGEECDEGYAGNNDVDSTCTLACKFPVCGDGLVWQGHENCDNGPNNNDSLYNGCTTECELGPHCGDNIIQDSEECDAGPANGTGETPSEDGVACESLCRFSAKVVFITSLEYTGKEVGGVTGAHQRCKERAVAAMLDNSDKFKAFISAAGFVPADSEQFVHATIPYVRLDGIRVADDWEDLILHGPNPGISISEEGKLLEDKNVWTGTDPDGQMFLPEQTCAGWSSDSAVVKGAVGRSLADPTKWTNDSDLIAPCIYPARLYCFEQ